MSSPEDTNPNFLRASFSLEHQFQCVDDLIRFWKWFGPAKLGPWPERSDPWFAGLPSTFVV